MNSIIIRFAETSDAHAIALIHIASWQKIYRGHIPDSVLDTLSIKEREQQWFDLLSRDVKILVIEHNSILVGFASMCPARDDNIDPAEYGEISAIYLHPNVWHQGLGKKLCIAALSELKSRGFNQAILWVLKNNDQARKFYAAIGFVETDHTKIEFYAKNIALEEIRYDKKL